MKRYAAEYGMETILSATLERTEKTPENALAIIALHGYSRIRARVLFLTIISDPHSEAVYDYLGRRGKTMAELNREFFNVGDDIEILLRTNKAEWRVGRLCKK